MLEYKRGGDRFRITKGSKKDRKMDIVRQLILQVILIALNAVFACAEIAVISINDTKTAQLAAKGDKRAVRLAKLKSQPARFLATIQVAITLSGFLGSAFAADGFSDLLVNAILSTGIKISPAALDTIAVILITLILSYFTLIFGELVPKRVAMKNAEKLALALSGLISLISKLFAPIVWLLTVSTNGMLRLLGINPTEADDEVTEDEIRMMVDAGSENGAIDTEEKELIQNVFEFDDTTATEIATHRTGIAILWTGESIDEWEKTILGSRHTFFPVCDGTIDNVVGVLSSKDYFRINSRTKENVMSRAVRAPYFVPESMKANVLFKNMKNKRCYFAVVMDEYGGMSGIVTIMDLLECIVGDIYDEHETQQTPEIEPLDSKTWRIKGSAPVDEVEKALGIALDCDSDTFAGYVLNYVGSIPDNGTVMTVESELMSIKITGIKDHRVESTMVTLKNAPATEE